MSNTTFNTRLKLKYDTLSNWAANNPLLLKGEVALVEVPASNEAATTAPTVLMKVGDGEKNFNDLSYTSSKAADVYGWAKAATKPTYAASEITGLSDYISGKVQDTDTQYKIDFADGKVRLFSKALGEEFGTTPVAEAEIPVDTLVAGSANGTVSFNGTDVAVKGLGSAAYAATSDFDAAGAADAVDTKVTALGSRVTAIEGDYLKTADKTALETSIAAAKKAGDDAQTTADNVKDKLDAFLSDAAVGGAAVDTLKEIQDYITSDGSAAASVTTKIGALETKVGNSSVSDQIDAKISALNLAGTYDAKGAASAAQAAAITDAASKYQPLEAGKGLSTNDFTNDLKTKVEGVEAGAQVNKIEEIEVNGVAATVANKKATVSVSLDKIEANTAENYVIFDCGSSSVNV